MEKINKKLLNWASILDLQTREQAVLTAQMPFIHPHLALMPDAHLGKGATVGSVIPTVGAIMPAAVGVDIGCGMDAILTQFTKADIESRGSLAPLREAIEAAIPLSAGNYNTEVAGSAAARIEYLEVMAERHSGFDPRRYAGNWAMQLGTLGSGNHFIEISLDEFDRVWLFLHSGSRGVGNKIAMKHIKVAQEYCKRHYIDLPHPDLAYLVEGTQEFARYISELRWAQEFARQNRAEMMDRVRWAVSAFMGEAVQPARSISCHHNYTEREFHAGQNVWLSRKGAISAKAGEWGLIPGSMGDKSYVVKGLGSPAAMSSAPHGAGRVHSRSAARKLFTQEDLRERMAGVEYRDTDAFIDEHPLAYKAIDQVMDDAKDLVEIVHTLRQILNVKGD